jgi:hypothetical protein
MKTGPPGKEQGRTGRLERVDEATGVLNGSGEVEAANERKIIFLMEIYLIYVNIPRRGTHCVTW